MVRRFGGIASFIALLGIPVSHAADPIQIAFIDPLSGPFANVGEVTLRHFYLAVEGLNARGGVLGGRKFELVPLDSKGSAQEAQLVLQQVADRGIRFVTQGLGANVAHALLDGIERHNSRNPDRTILYLNYAAILPAFTNEKCSFWHFRFDADVDMKMSAFTDAIAENKRLSKVYLINQDYEFGHAVARAARQFLNQKRPDIQIVGDDLHPLGKLKDFAPYVAKIKASGAQAVITGNWGNDLVLLIRAAGDAGLELEYFTYYGGALGAPMAIGDVGVEFLPLGGDISWSQVSSGCPDCRSVDCKRRPFRPRAHPNHRWNQDHERKPFDCCEHDLSFRFQRTISALLMAAH
jgi:branched-chain amino acid transport system substrate-binding protein